MQIYRLAWSLIALLVALGCNERGREERSDNKVTVIESKGDSSIEQPPGIPTGTNPNTGATLANKATRRFACDPLCPTYTSKDGSKYSVKGGCYKLPNVDAEGHQVCQKNCQYLASCESQVNCASSSFPYFTQCLCAVGQTKESSNVLAEVNSCVPPSVGTPLPNGPYQRTCQTCGAYPQNDELICAFCRRHSGEEVKSTLRNASRCTQPINNCDGRLTCGECPPVQPPKPAARATCAFASTSPTNCFVGNIDGKGGTDVFSYDPNSGDTNILWDGRRSSALSKDKWTLGYLMVPGDFDGDRYSDLLLYNQKNGNVEIRYGDIDQLRYTATSKDRWSLGHKLIPGDYDGDGRSDVFIYSSTGDVEIRFGSQHANALGYRSETSDRWSTDYTLVPGDFNGDNISDLFLYHKIRGSIEIRFGDKTGILRASADTADTWTTGQVLTPGDFNCDGLSDILVYNSISGGVEIRYGQRSGTLRFSKATQDKWSLGHTFLAGDFNGDRCADLLIYNEVASSVEVRYGRVGDGIRYSKATIDKWVPGHRLFAGNFNADQYTDVLIYDGASGSAEIRYGRSEDGLNYDASSVQKWHPNLDIVIGTANSY